MIAPSAGSELKAEVITEYRCLHCGGKPADLGEHCRELGEEAAKALYSGTPYAFWQAIEDFAVERALSRGAVKRPVLDYRHGD